MDIIKKCYDEFNRMVALIFVFFSDSGADFESYSVKERRKDLNSKNFYNPYGY